MPDDSNVQMISNHQQQTVIFKVLPPRPAGSASLGKLLEMHILRLQHRPNELETNELETPISIGQSDAL